MQDYRKLKVWEKAHQLTLAVYKATTSFPREELYGLTSPIRRCASSVPSNIVEGCGLDTKAQFTSSLFHALGSANELEYQLLLCRDLGYIDATAYETLAADTLEVKRMLSALIVNVRRGMR